MHCHTPKLSPARRQAGMALVVVITLLAIVALFAVVLFQALIREIDHDVARQESAALKAFGNALQSAIQRHAYIPAHTNWADMVAAETGVSLPSVATNPRRQPRLLLIDTNGWFGAVSLPYSQTYNGTTILPANARLLLASSLGKPLPLSAGALRASDFDALWKAAEGTTNFPTTGPYWAGWGGRSEDVKLERIHLSPLFVSLYLMTYASAATGQYSIGTNSALYPAPYYNTASPPPPHYYIQNTVLRLYNASPGNTLDSSQILIRDGSFIYENGMWKSSAAGGIMPGGIDLPGIIFAFMNAVPNTQARHGADQQRRVVLSMMDYMSNYLAWADGGFADGNLKTYLKSTVQPNMMTTLQDLFMGAYYPTNAGVGQ